MTSRQTSPEQTATQCLITTRHLTAMLEAEIAIVKRKLEALCCFEEAATEDLSNHRERLGALESQAKENAKTAVRLQELEASLKEDPDIVTAWWIEVKGNKNTCRLARCTPECPAYDYGCRYRADTTAGDNLDRIIGELRGQLGRLRSVVAKLVDQPTMPGALVPTKYYEAWKKVYEELYRKRDSRSKASD